MRVTFDKLPLFATDRDIGEALLGPSRACEWKDMAPLYEPQGLPEIDPVMGGRYTPAIKQFFDRRYGLNESTPSRPDGAENPEIWTKTARRAHQA